MRGFGRLLRIACEDDDKVIEREEERVFYGRLKDVGQLKNADSMEQQEQYEVKVGKSSKNITAGRMRVRKTVKQGESEPTYTFTVKTPSIKEGDFETNTPATEQMFIQFKGMCESGMMKDRYIFKAGSLSWEVDVYPGPNGQYQPWVRIELEVQDFQGEIPELPVDLEEAIVAPVDQQTPEEKAKIQTLFETVFLRPNPYLNVKSVESGAGADEDKDNFEPKPNDEPPSDDNKSEDGNDGEDKDNKPEDNDNSEE